MGRLNVGPVTVYVHRLEIAEVLQPRASGRVDQLAVFVNLRLHHHPLQDALEQHLVAKDPGDPAKLREGLQIERLFEKWRDSLAPRLGVQTQATGQIVDIHGHRDMEHFVETEGLRGAAPMLVVDDGEQDLHGPGVVLRPVDDPRAALGARLGPASR